MSGISGKIKLLSLMSIVLLTAGFVFADTYKNNVVDVKITPETNSAVKITIYTDKPYTEPVVVNKKANNKYVILMPETNSSLKSGPSLTNLSGTISNVSVSTQDVSGGKGYTKITITSDKAVTIIPRTRQYVTSSAQSAAKSAAAVSNTSKSTVAKSSNQPKKQIADSTNKKQDNNQIKTSNVSKAVTESKNKIQQDKKVVSEQKTANVQKNKPVQKPIEVLEQEVKTGISQPVVSDKTDEILNNEIKENVLINEKKKKSAASKKKNNVVIDGSSLTFRKGIRAIFNSCKGVDVWKLLLLAIAIAFPLLVIFIILSLDKKINKKIDNTIKNQSHEVSAAACSEEKADTAFTPVNAESYERTPVENDSSGQYNTFDDLLSNIDEPSYENSVVPVVSDDIDSTEEVACSQDSEVDEIFENDFDDKDFENVQIAEAVNEEDLTEEDYNDILTDKDDYTEASPILDNSNEIEQEEIDITPVDNINERSDIVEPEKEFSEEIVSDYKEINDKDFFDELAIQSMAANNSSGLPENSPADEIFDFMTEDSCVEDMESKGDDYTEINNLSDIADKDNLTMLKEVKLNDNTGLYLVNYENFSSLVGHINDDYFVIKKFDNVINDEIYFKETEKLKDLTRYLVRVGKNKMVVEVSETSMSRLLDL